MLGQIVRVFVAGEPGALLERPAPVACSTPAEVAFGAPSRGRVSQLLGRGLLHDCGGLRVVVLHVGFAASGDDRHGFLFGGPRRLLWHDFLPGWLLV